MQAIDHVLEALVLEALVFEAQHKTDLALNALKRALMLGEPRGYVRIFVDEGAPMGRSAPPGCRARHRHRLRGSFADWR